MKNNAVISPVRQVVTMGLAFCLMISSITSDRQYYEDCYNVLHRIVCKKKKKTVKRFK